MGLLDLGANILMKIKVDPSQAKAALKDLSGEERKVAEAAIKATEAQNKALEKKAANWRFAAQAIGGVTAAYALGSKGLEAYAKTSLSAGNEVRRIQEVTSKAMDGVMASIGKTVVQMEPLITGFAKVAEKLTEIGAAGPIAIGLLGAAITGNPAIGAFLGIMTWAGGQDFQGGTAMDVLRAGGVDKAALGVYRSQKAQREADARALAEAGRYSAGAAGASLFGASNSGLAGNGPTIGGKAKLIVTDPKTGKPVELYGEARRRALRAMLAEGGGGIEDLYDGPQRYSGSSGLGASSLSQRDMDSVFRLDTQGPLTEKLTAGWFDKLNPEMTAAQATNETHDSFLAKTFGPISDFDVYAAAFESLSGAVGSALGAWIDGSMSAGEAFKAFIAEAVKGIAIQMAMEAIKHGAYALGSLAFGNVAGAALHGKAAAGFAAGAVVAAAAAKGLNGSSASTGGYSPSAPTTATGGGTPAAQSSPVIVVGDPFAYDSPRNQQRIAKRLVSTALSTSAVTYG